MGTDLLLASLIAVIMSAGILVGLRLRLPGVAWMLFACAPGAAILAQPAQRIFSYHGLMHASIVERVRVAWPPTDPLLAGTPLPYPWLPHALVAWISDGLSIPAGSAFALVSLATFPITIVLLHATARRLGARRPAATLGTVLATFGIAPFCAGPLAAVMTHLFGFQPEHRLIAAQKFTTVNSNQLGLLCFALFLYAMTGLFARREDVRRHDWLLLGGATLGAHLLYPIAGAAIIVAAVGAALLLVIDGSTRRSAVPDEAPKPSIRPTIAGALGLVIAATLLALPYLGSLQHAKVSESALGLALDGATLANHAANLTLTFAGLGSLAFVMRRSLRTPWQSQRAPWLVVIGSGASLALTYGVVQQPLASEYKFLMLAVVCAGLAGGVPLAALLERRPVVAAGVVALFLLPACATFVDMRRIGAASAEIASDGARLVHPDPTEAALLAWIRDHTGGDDAFVDAELTIPPYGARSLFVGIDPGRDWIDQRSNLQGWGMTPSTILGSVFGHAHERIKRRREVTRALLSPDAAARPISAATIARLVEASDGHELYVVARHPAVRSRLSADERFEEVRQIGSGGLFRVRVGHD